MRRTRHLLLCGALILGGLAACGDDDDSGDDGTEQDDANDNSTDNDTADESESDDGGSASNSDVQDYCDDVGEYVEHAQEVLADADLTDPNDPEVLALQEEAQELSDRGEELQDELDAAGLAELSECATSMGADLPSG